MLPLQIGLLQAQAAPAPRALPGLDLGPAPEPNGRRDKIWELSPSLHCSIIGTCLTTGALRQLFGRLNHADAKTASDHELHSRAVRLAGQHDVGGKMLHRMLDKRHEAHVKRFSRAKTTPELRALWLEALERGDIPGAYWAALTHPAADQALLAEIFGEVHMLSHLVGMSNRADIVRLRALERELGERDEKIARQEVRMQRMSRERDALTRRIDALDCEMKRRQACAAAGTCDDPSLVAALRQRLEGEQARSAQLSGRLAERECVLADREDELRRGLAQAQALRQEIAALEQTLADLAGSPEEAGETAPKLDGRRLLYVGGRPRQLDQLRALARRLGGTLLTHDGGLEESTTLLPGLVGQADVALFPVDCVSHRAMTQVKRLCRDAGKPYVPLRGASVASFLMAVGNLGRDALHDAPEA
jgi:hypothetical protein